MSPEKGGYDHKVVIEHIVLHQGFHYIKKRLGCSECKL